MAKVYLVYERVPYAGIEDVLHVFTTEEEAQNTVVWYKKKYKILTIKGIIGWIHIGYPEKLKEVVS
jgi:hypothetical protein